MTIADQYGFRSEEQFPAEWQAILIWVRERVRPFAKSDFHWVSGLPIETGATLLQRLIGMSALTASGALYFT